jgi:hypothetical protein
VKGVIKWLRAVVFRPSASTNSEPVEIRAPLQEVVMPDIYGEAHEDTQPLIKILDPTSPDTEESTGFDPYDTVVLHEKQGVKKD